MVDKIKIVDVVGCRLCVSSEDGQKLYDFISKLFQDHKTIVLSFSDMTNITSVFLNTAIGQLYGKFSEDYIKTHLSVADMENDDKLILKRVVDRAKDYFTDPEPYDEAINNLIGDCNE